MADLRSLLTDAGYENVRTYGQSGNVVVTSPSGPRELERAAHGLISERFGFDVPVIARSHAELADVVRRDPFGDIVEDPKLYQVSFLSSELSAETVNALQELAQAPERLVASSRELYAWHPNGIARSQLAKTLGGKKLGVAATARNWKTVTMLLEMAAE
jgi:uncharacterized protein (DUF1697 family)